VMALIGMVTRSTVASLLLTVLLWACLFGVNLTDGGLMFFTERQTMVAEQRTARIERMETNTTRMLVGQHEPGGAEDAGVYQPSDEELLTQNPFLGGERGKLRHDQDVLKQLRFWSRLVVVVKTALPKTGETIGLLERHLIDPDAMAPPEPKATAQIDDQDQDVEVDQGELAKRLAERQRARPLWWIVGTSMVFELVITGITCLIFARRDF